MHIIEKGEARDDLNCIMQFTLHSGQSSYPITTSGQLEEYVTDEGSVILHGCLRGQVAVGGKEYKVTVGLTKEPNNSSVNAGVSLMPVGNGLPDDVVVFKIGDYIISPSAEAVLTEGAVAVEPTSAAEPNQARVSSSVLNVDAKIVNSISQAIGVRVTVDQTALIDYLDEHYSYGGYGGGYNYSLYEMSVGVKHTSDYFTLNGLYTNSALANPDLDFDDDNDAMLFWAVLCDALSYYGVQTIIITQLFSSLKGSYSEITDKANNLCVTLRGSDLYDGIESIGLACTVAVSPNSSLTPGSDNATGYGLATYRVTQHIPLAGPAIVYADIPEQTDDVVVQIG